MLPSSNSAEKRIQITSLVAKVTVWCDFYRCNRNKSDYPVGMMEVISEEAEQGKLTFMRAVSKEIDVQIRELLTDGEQLSLIETMKNRGVILAHLPNLPSMKSVRALIKRGSIRSIEEAHITNLFLGERSALLDDEELSNLGRMFDEYSAKQSKSTASGRRSNLDA